MAIWHIEEPFEDLQHQLQLSSEDKALIDGFGSEKKKLEWLSGRLCLKHLCVSMGIDYQGLRKNTTGKPYLRNSSAEISLTHSHPYVAAIIDLKTDVGIDLEQPKEKLIRLAHKFLNAEEMKTAGDDIKALCIYWCAKETLYKICDQRISFKDHMSIEINGLAHKGSLIGKVIVNDTLKSYKLEYRIEKDYILTFNI